MVQTPESYKNEVPVPPLDGGDTLADIFITVDVISFLELDEVESYMRLQYKLTLKWKDPRITFRNLKNETFLNTLGKEDAGKIWYPQLVKYNTESMEETQVTNYLRMT